ncbi:hypothetical protein [Pleionea sp. CnH1-48]|uniref:hypothetical protein n=1 Tax=Pleionea sp. CnH1-48 TaxID=2954494 RepID=UPI002096AE06|nr:hypothetical protein [Pleionea sp. CnH1-48]MCO7225175.1 hypothetical protein [Pleionea sp. CnH1-48]
MIMKLKKILALSVALLIAGCGDDNIAKVITISGTLTYDHVPHGASFQLDYDNTAASPIRGAVVQLLDASDSVVETTASDGSGNYSFQVVLLDNQSTTGKIRVLSQMLQTGTPSWDFSVVDNTNSNATYALDGEQFTTQDSLTQNLHAASGWGGTDYTAPRAAAPFAILDSIYIAYNKILEVDADAAFPALLINWSVDNVPFSGDLAAGQIGTSFYSDGNIYVLGASDADTDEYDGHVIVHEWGHYFEDKFARADSIGGAHSGGDRLDPRVAFGEGWGNAWAGMATDDSLYQDSFGVAQGNGFGFDVENNNNTNPGWFSEGSVQSILYDLYDTTNEGDDSLSMGFAPIYNVLVGNQRTTNAFTTIFSFITYLKQANANDSAAIDTLVGAQSIVSSSMDIYGSTESNDGGGTTFVLPIYTEMTVGGATKVLCSTDQIGAASSSKFNKIGARRFAYFNVAADGDYQFTAISQTNDGDPDILISRAGEAINPCSATDDRGCLVNRGEERLTLTLTSGDYLAEVLDFNNVDSGASGRDNCIDFTIATATN